MIPFPAGDFTWTAAGAWASFLALVGIIVRQVGPWRKISVDAETVFRDNLIARVEKLERDLQRKDQEGEQLRRLHNAERAVDRHRINNLQQCFDAMLMMIDAAPEKAAEIVTKIREMRAEQLKAEALEKAAVHEVAINAVGNNQ